MPLTNSQYDALMRSYQQKQLRNQRFVTERREELYRKIPLLSDLDAQIAAVSMTAARKTLEGDQDAIRQLHRQIAALHEQKQSLIRAAGYPDDYLTPPYDCSDCKDTGYIGSERCHCFRQAAIDLIYRQSHLADVLARENFDTFNLDYYSKSNKEPRNGHSSYEIAKEALSICKSYVKNFGTKGGNLILIGTPGVGKTFLTNCIAGALLDQSYSVIYFTAFQLIDVFEKSTFEHSDEARRDYDNIFSCDLLIIDDLGAELNNSFSNSKLFEVINERLIRGRSTVISSNLTMGQLRDTYSDRIYSRIASNYKFIRLFGEDIRIEKKIRHM